MPCYVPANAAALWIMYALQSDTAMFWRMQLTLRAWRDLALEPERKIWVGFGAEHGNKEQGYDIILCWRGTVVRFTP